MTPWITRALAVAILGAGACSSSDSEPVAPDAMCVTACPENFCGEIEDGCGGTISCGCPAPAECGAGGTPDRCAVPAAAQDCEGNFCRLSPYPRPMIPTDMFATAADDVWAVGAGGEIRHFDGTAWRELAVTPAMDLRAVWGSSPSDIWMVGDAGTVAHYDGSTLSKVDAGTGEARLTGVWGTSGEVWVVGDGVSARFDGATWAPAAATSPSLTHVFAAGTSDVWATGQGTVWRLQDAQWSAIEPIGDETFAGIFGRAPDEIFAVGFTTTCDLLICDRDELVLAYDGTAWTSIDTPVEDRVDDVYGSDEQVVALRGDSLFPLAGEAALPQPPLTGVQVGAQVSASQQFVLARGGEPVVLEDSTWNRPAFGPYGDLVTVAAAGDGAVAAGADGIVAWQGGLATTDVGSLPDGDGSAALASIAATGAGDVWVIDLDAFFERSENLWHYDGARWQRLALPAENVGFYQLLAVAEGDVVAVGERIFRGDGEMWREIAGSDAEAVWRGGAIDDGGRLWVAGVRETPDEDAPIAVLAHADGGALVEEQEVAGLEVACAVYAAAANDVWVAGYQVEDAFLDEYQGAMAHWDGTQWTVTALGVTGQFCSMAAVAPDDMYVAGGGLFHFDGATWAAIAAPSAGKIRSVSAAAGGIWAAGDFGTLVFEARPDPGGA